MARNGCPPGCRAHLEKKLPWKRDNPKIPQVLHLVITDNKSHILIGRAPHVDICLDSSYRPSFISREHCILSKSKGNVWTIRDMKSMNGVAVNGLRILAHKLSDGDEISLGSANGVRPQTPVRGGLETELLFTFTSHAPMPGNVAAGASAPDSQTPTLPSGTIMEDPPVVDLTGPEPVPGKGKRRAEGAPVVNGTAAKKQRPGMPVGAVPVCIDIAGDDDDQGPAADTNIADLLQRLKDMEQEKEAEAERLREERKRNAALEEELKTISKKAKDTAADDGSASLVNALEESITCPICQDFFVVPTTTNCSHTFCGDCLTGWLKKNKNCPTCRTLVKTQVETREMVNVVEGVVSKLPEGDSKWYRERIQIREREKEEKRKKEEAERRRAGRTKEILDSAKAELMQLKKSKTSIAAPGRKIWDIPTRETISSVISKTWGPTRVQVLGLIGLSEAVIRKSNLNILRTMIVNFTPPSVPVPAIKSKGTAQQALRLVLIQKKPLPYVQDYLSGKTDTLKKTGEAGSSAGNKVPATTRTSSQPGAATPPTANGAGPSTVPPPAIIDLCD